MSFSVARPQMTRRVRRKLERMYKPKPRMKTAPPLTRSTRVVVRAEPGCAEEEELLLLGALRELKLRYDKIDLEYVTEFDGIYNLLPTAWFLKRSHFTQPDRDYDPFEEIVRNDFALTLFEPDPQAAEIAEKDLYEKGYEIELEKIRVQQEAYDKAGMKDVKVPVPPHHFQPQWNKGNAYLWTMADQLGLEIDIPTEPFPPYGEVSRPLQKRTRRALSQAHMGNRPFAVYDLQSEAEEITLAGALGAVMRDRYELISIQALQKVVGTELDALLAVLSDDFCQLVVAPVGPVLYAAWGAGVPNIFTMYSGNNPNWDSVHAAEKRPSRTHRATVNNFPLNRDQFDDEQLPQAFTAGLQFLKGQIDAT
jgi:hypothetical protein